MQDTIDSYKASYVRVFFGIFFWSSPFIRGVESTGTENNHDGLIESYNNSWWITKFFFRSCLDSKSLASFYDLLNPTAETTTAETTTAETTTAETTAETTTAETTAETITAARTEDNIYYHGPVIQEERIGEITSADEAYNNLCDNLDSMFKGLTTDSIRFDPNQTSEGMDYCIYSKSYTIATAIQEHFFPIAIQVKFQYNTYAVKFAIKRYININDINEKITSFHGKIFDKVVKAVLDERGRLGNSLNIASTSDIIIKNLIRKFISGKISEIKDGFDKEQSYDEKNKIILSLKEEFYREIRDPESLLSIYEKAQVKTETLNKQALQDSKTELENREFQEESLYQKEGKADNAITINGITTETTLVADPSISQENLSNLSKLLANIARMVNYEHRKFHVILLGKEYDGHEYLYKFILESFGGLSNTNTLPYEFGVTVGSSCQKEVIRVIPKTRNDNQGDVNEQEFYEKLFNNLFGFYEKKLTDNDTFKAGILKLKEELKSNPSLSKELTISLITYYKTRSNLPKETRNDSSDLVTEDNLSTKKQLTLRVGGEMPPNSSSVSGLNTQQNNSKTFRKPLTPAGRKNQRTCFFRNKVKDRLTTNNQTIDYDNFRQPDP